MTDAEQADTAEAVRPEGLNPYQSIRYRNYVLGVLTLTYAFNMIDRQLLSILQESVKHDLHLSDTQLGLLTGFAFALFYVTAGIPIARLADRANRRNIIALAVGVWSFMTAITGFCQNFVQMLLARIGVGIGEAGCSPPAHSMISDIFPPASRATAMAVYSVGLNIGIMFGFLLGGFLNEVVGWRWTFVLVGAPGVLLAVLIRMSIKEPARGWAERRKVSHDHVPIGMFIKRLAGKPALRHLLFGAALAGVVHAVNATWIAPFFIRSHDMGTAELGVWLAMSAGVCGGLGTFLGGYLADRLGKRDRRWYMWLPSMAVLLTIPFLAFVYTTDNLALALWANFLPGLLFSVYLGPSIAVMHSMVGPRMRATASALFFFVLNIIGAGVGPILVGAISDYLAPGLGDESLRHALLYISPFAALWASVHFFISARHLRRDME